MGRDLKFLALNATAQGYMAAFMLLTYIVLLIAFIAELMGKKHIIRRSTLFLLIITSLLCFSAFMERIYFQNYRIEFELLEITRITDVIPLYIYIIGGVASITFAVYVIYDMFQYNKSTINRFSVKEAIENLPTGIAFMTKDIDLCLSNHIMNGLSKELTGKTLHSGEELWADILELQSQDTCVLNSKEPAFVLSTGEIWQFSKTTCTWNGENYEQIKATDITQLYKLSAHTKRVNEKLSKQQQRLKELTDRIEHNVEQQVTVNMKVNFHDNFGNLLTLTKKTLREKPDIDESRALIQYWEDLTDMIHELSSEDKHKLTLEQIKLFAAKLGFRLLIDGELPTEKHHRMTILLCINEMLKNTHRYANTDKLEVYIIQTEEMILMRIHNDDKNPPLKIKEGGGLLGLRQRIEQLGGEMKLSCERGVTMAVKLYKEKDGDMDV